MLASLLGFAHESPVIDNDIIGAVLRTLRGIEVDEEALSVEVIREVCLEGPGHYLAARQTLERMQTDYVYPEAGDRTSPKEWVELGPTEVVGRAAREAGEILAAHYPAHIDATSDAFVRERLPIRLLRQAMRPRAPLRKGAAA
jgi:trimethylamine--corrinoid protein Co-methyltransferase